MSKFNAAMVDLEFLDTRPSSAILAVAIVGMNTDTYEIGEGFKINADASDCMRRGMTVSADTIRFWNKQDAAAFDDAFDIDIRYRHTLELLLFKVHNAFAEIAPKQTLQVWQKGVLDTSILTYGYDLISKPLPYEFWNINDYRVLANLYPDVCASVKREGPKHHCLEDAKHQARELMAVLKHLRTTKPADSNQKEKPTAKKLADLDDDL